MTEKPVKRVCVFWCKPRCLLDVYIKDNRLEGVSQPPIKGCPRWRRAKKIFSHPERLRFPLMFGFPILTFAQTTVWSTAMKQGLGHFEPCCAKYTRLKAMGKGAFRWQNSFVRAAMSG